MTHATGLDLVEVPCVVCGSDEAELVGSGHDYEYETSPDRFYAFVCSECGNVYLNPRPHTSEFSRIYPEEYHSLEFTPESFSLVHRVRSRLEARRLLRYCAGAPDGARILDVGCGDGFHLSLLKRFGERGWTVEGVDIDERAVEAAQSRGLTVHLGVLGEVDLEPASYDVIYTLQTIEHVAEPRQLMEQSLSLLKPGGRLVIVTDNTETPDFRMWKRHFWGGYHFPRHWNLFNRRSLARLARAVGFEVASIDTIVSPVNWVYSIHNYLVAKNAPRWITNRFTLKAPVALAVFTVLDGALQVFGRGALLCARLERPKST